MKITSLPQFKTPVDLYGLSLCDWDELCAFLACEPIHQKKLVDSIFLGAPESISEIRGIPNEILQRLASVAVILKSHRHTISRSSDGSARLTMMLHDGHLAETVILPEWKRGMLVKCSASISSQIGCFFGCSFCATGQMGFHRNLSTGELLDQIRESEQHVLKEYGQSLTHLYFMGMGEPLHNYRALSDVLNLLKKPGAPLSSDCRITISTVGLYRQIRMLAHQHPEVRLAVSIHSAEQDKRVSIMPVSARLPLRNIRDAMFYHYRKTGHSVTIQYLLLKNVNDKRDDAQKLAEFLDDLPARITLIMYNEVSESQATPTDQEKLHNFKAILEKAGRSVDIRWCAGVDIQAGCGQLQVSICQERSQFTLRTTGAKTH